MKPLKAFGCAPPPPLPPAGWLAARRALPSCARRCWRELRVCSMVPPRACTPPSPRSYTVETLEVLLAPMAKAGADPLGSMGNDAPLAPMRCAG